MFAFEREDFMRNFLKVLIVEDDIISALLLWHYLKFLKYDTCIIATTGEEAVKIAYEEIPDIVLMDIFLAGKMNGIETAKKIKFNNNNTTIAFLTSCDEKKIMEDALKISPAAYFIKPIKLDKIKEFLDSINKSHLLPVYLLNELNYEKIYKTSEDNLF